METRVTAACSEEANLKGLFEFHSYIIYMRALCGDQTKQLHFILVHLMVFLNIFLSKCLKHPGFSFHTLLTKQNLHVMNVPIILKVFSSCPAA